MASLSSPSLFILLFFLFFAFPIRCRLVPAPSPSLSYHGGPLLHGPLSLHLLWYGSFSLSQQTIITDFLFSFTAPSLSSPSVPQWWQPISLYSSSHSLSSSPPLLQLGLQATMSPSLSFGFSLNKTTFSLLLQQALSSGSLPTSPSAIYIILTAKDVMVEDFCMSTCGLHAYMEGRREEKLAYIWAGNAGEQCPGECAWPFAEAVFGPQVRGLAAPNEDVGMDGMVISIGTLLAGTVTNPFNTGYYQGDMRVPREAGSACTGMFGGGAYPGYPGHLLVSNGSGASYNVHGIHKRTFLLPALLDPSTSKCITLP